MKLEVGQYVRTKYGIRKIIKIDDNNRYYDNNYYIDKRYINNFRQEIDCITANCIIGEPSFNIIDLIEIGDNVNGSKVVEVDFDAEEEKYIRIDKAQDGLKTILRNNDIKSIVTKEMFSSMEYRLGDDK